MVLRKKQSFVNMDKIGPKINILIVFGMFSSFFQANNGDVFRKRQSNALFEMFFDQSLSEILSF